MKVTLLSHTPNPEKLISIAAKNCYSPYSITQTQENLENGEIEKFVTMLVNIGHESPLEHISFTFLKTQELLVFVVNVLRVK